MSHHISFLNTWTGLNIENIVPVAHKTLQLSYPSQKSEKFIFPVHILGGKKVELAFRQARRSAPWDFVANTWTEGTRNTLLQMEAGAPPGVRRDTLTTVTSRRPLGLERWPWRT